MLMEAKNDIKEEPMEESEPSRGNSATKKETNR